MGAAQRYREWHIWRTTAPPAMPTTAAATPCTARPMYPRPPNMRQKDTQELSDGELYYTIKRGPICLACISYQGASSAYF